MIFHLALGLLHSVPTLIGHSVSFTSILYLLFRRASDSYFHSDLGPSV